MPDNSDINASIVSALTEIKQQLATNVSAADKAKLNEAYDVLALALAESALNEYGLAIDRVSDAAQRLSEVTNAAQGGALAHVGQALAGLAQMVRPQQPTAEVAHDAPPPPPAQPEPAPPRQRVQQPRQVRNSNDGPMLPGHAAATPDKECIARLIQLASDAASLHQIQAIAANSMNDAGYGYTMHNACAAVLSAFLNSAGIPIQTTLGAGRLARRLATERNWIKIAVGKQQAGDVGVAENDAHIYLVVDTAGTDKMTISDNQASTPHSRFASGKGKTPTAYFLRAPDDTIQVARLESSFFPSVDQDTSELRIA